MNKKQRMILSYDQSGWSAVDDVDSADERWLCVDSSIVNHAVSDCMLLIEREYPGFAGALALLREVDTQDVYATYIFGYYVSTETQDFKQALLRDKVIEKLQAALLLDMSVSDLIGSLSILTRFDVSASLPLNVDDTNSHRCPK